MHFIAKQRRLRFLWALRTLVPVLALMAILLFAIFTDNRSLSYNLFLLLLGFIASTLFVVMMFFTGIKESILDPITQTYGRHFFLDHLKEKRYLILISIQNIKEINERYGYEKGDHLLATFARYLYDFFSQYEKKPLLSRFKSGDFLIACSCNDSQKLVEDFLKKYDNRFIDNIQIKLKAAVEPLENSPKSIINRLYEDIYYAKRAKSDIEKYLPQILEKEDLVLFFQPILDLQRGSFPFAEVSVKFFFQGKLIHPSEYMPAINRLGLERSFYLILAKKIASLKFPQNIAFFLPISPYALRNEHFFKALCQILIEPKRYILELYEKSVYKDISFYTKILQNYRQKGFLIAFDRFGGCNASVEYIKAIDPDFVCFDRYFTKSFEQSKIRALLTSWLGFFQKTATKSVVKFVDSESILNDIKKMEANYAQGFAIAKPMKLDAFKKFLGDENALR